MDYSFNLSKDSYFWFIKLSVYQVSYVAVGSIVLAGLYRLVWGKLFTAHIWDRFINNNHPLSDASLVDDVMLHHAVSNNNEIKITYF